MRSKTRAERFRNSSSRPKPNDKPPTEHDRGAQASERIEARAGVAARLENAIFRACEYEADMAALLRGRVAGGAARAGQVSQARGGGQAEARVRSGCASRIPSASSASAAWSRRWTRRQRRRPSTRLPMNSRCIVITLGILSDISIDLYPNTHTHILLLK